MVVESAQQLKCLRARVHSKNKGQPEISDPPPGARLLHGSSNAGQHAGQQQTKERRCHISQRHQHHTPTTTTTATTTTTTARQQLQRAKQVVPPRTGNNNLPGRTSFAPSSVFPPPKRRPDERLTEEAIRKRSEQVQAQPRRVFSTSVVAFGSSRRSARCGQSRTPHRKGAATCMLMCVWRQSRSTRTNPCILTLKW
jgi:hypothetical protein